MDSNIPALKQDLIALGVRQGGVLLVHSSLRAFGPTFSQANHGAERVIQALLDALGPTGTLLMPALSYETVVPSNPYFDVSSTPSCVGALAETFRTRTGTLRSVHPTHSVSGIGPRTSELFAGHEQSTTPCGPLSPFARLPQVGGQILFLGCGLEPNTSMHGVEELVEPPYLYADFLDYHVTLADRRQITMRIHRHDFAGWEQRYDRLEGVMKRGLRKGLVGQAACYLLESAQVWEDALQALRKDPLFFVEKTL